MYQADILTIFFMVDNFCKEFNYTSINLQITPNKRSRQRNTRISISEIVTILLLFQFFNYRNFKSFYIQEVLVRLNNEFPRLVCYSRFVELSKRAMTPMVAFAVSVSSKSDGIAFIDATSITVCHNKRINSNRVFEGIAKRGKTTKGWFYGFKLHIVINHQCEIVSFSISPGNTDDRKPVLALLRDITGKVYGDKGYISKELAMKLKKYGVELITNVRKNMKPIQMSEFDQLMMKQRGIIESTNNQLKNKFHLEHTRHRSVWGFFMNIFSVLAAYATYPHKPKIFALDRVRAALAEAA